MKVPAKANERKAKVTPETLQEAAELKRLWGSREHPGQAVFGEVYEIGNQSAVGQFLRGETPLSLKAARGFAKGLGVDIAEFSPRLASEVAKSAEYLQSNHGNLGHWPFPDIDRARFERLSPRQQIEIQGVVRERIERFESPSLPAHERAPAAEGRVAANGHNPSKKRSNGQ